jgi:hypothetical protein
MQPTLVAKPFHRAGWIYEEKYDGWRMVAQARYREGERGFQEGHQTPRASKGTRRSGERV